MAICYRNGESPPNLPIAVTVRFDSYRGPTLSDGTVPITPLHRTWSASGGSCSRLQLPLKLAWAVTIHKAQGLTLNKVVIDVGKKEFSAGLTFVACSRVRRMNDLLFDPPFPFQRVANLANSQRLQERLLQDTKLLLLDGSTLAPQDPCEAISSYMSSQLPTQTPPSSCSSTPLPPPMDSQAPTPTPPSSRSSTPSLPSTCMDSLAPTPTPPSSRSSTPPLPSPMDSQAPTPTPPSSRSSTPPLPSPMDSQAPTPTPPSSRSSTPPLPSPMDSQAPTPTPPSSHSSTPSHPSMPT